VEISAHSKICVDVILTLSLAHDMFALCFLFVTTPGTVLLVTLRVFWYGFAD